MALTDAVRPSPTPSPAPSPSRSMFSKPPMILRPTTPIAAVPSTPSRNKDKENRRRSWFGLVTPTRNKDKDKDKDRSVSAGPVFALAAPGPRQADDNSIEELEATPQRRSTEDRRARGRRGASSDAGGNDSDSDFMSTLDDDSDWEITGTVRRKRTLRSRQQEQQQQQQMSDSTDTTPVRQKDLATLAILSRNNTSQPKPLTSRIFSRTANESETATSPESNPSNLPPLSATITPSHLPQRTSSIVNNRSSKRMTNVPAPLPLYMDRSPVNKPLPQLPPHDAGLGLGRPPVPNVTLFSAPNDTHQPTSSPIPPTDIVVTPSSPHDRDPFEMPFSAYTVDRPCSAPPTSPQGMQRKQARPHLPRSQSPTPSPSFMSTGSSSIGLGLPDRHPRRLTAPSGKPLPAIVSVSSPLPQSARSPSPATKVTFATMQGSHDYDAKDQSDKVKAPRPRSFSAMFSRSPLLNLDHTDDEEPSTSKFNWLGVRKTIKRRRSESKLNQQRNPQPTASAGATNAGADDAAARPTNMSTPVLIPEPPRAESSSSATAAAATARPTSSPGQPAPDSQTPSSLASFVLPPVVQEEWWPASEWGEVEPQRQTPQRLRTPADKTPSERTRADTYTPDTPTDTPGDERDDAESKDSHGSSRRLPPSRTSSLLSSTGHALGSLPEGGLAPSASATPSVPPIDERQPQPKPVPAPPPRKDHNRRRSYSDAGRRSFVPMTDGPPQHQSLNNSPRTNFLAALTGEPIKSPKLSRPSSSSSTLVKMRSVFSIGNRSRSNSALRFGQSEEREDGRETPHTRPPSSASAASSFLPSPALPPVRIRPEDVPQVSQLQLTIGGDDDRRVVLSETPDWRSSTSLTSTPRTSHSTTRRSLTADPHAAQQAAGGKRATRARASTISSTGPVSWSGQFETNHSNHSTTGTFGTFGHPVGSVYGYPAYTQSIHGSLHGPTLNTGSAAHLPIPTPTFPTASTPPRRPNSIRRLSTGLFRSGAVSPKPHGVVRSGSGPIAQVPDDFNPRDSSQSQSRSGSVMGTAPVGPVDKGLDKKDVDTTVHADDTPESWLGRVLVISRRQLSSILAESSDKLHMDALRLYMSRFDFHHIALDVALRRLLMDLSLPKETQQIDRVIETFSQRYDVCEPGLFGTKDNTYVLAFSMMMLHTDAFNRHNKNKMTKADYVRNTRLDGVPETVLEAFYDNITFTPFIFIEDDNEASLAAVGAVTGANGPAGAVRPGKVDVYDMIAGGTIMTLRANVEAQIPPESPFSCMGTQAFLDVDRLQRAFADAHPLSFVKSRPRRKSSVTMPTLPGADKTPVKPVPKEEIQTLKITKVGLITRKDDTHVNGKRPSGRKWKNWSVILTGSQLLFFKDTILALTLVEQIRSSVKTDGEPIVPRMTGFQPDEVLSVKECVAIYDRDYTEAQFTFRFIMPQGRQYLLQALDEKEMNEWLTLINYASTFKSAGIRMRAQAIDSGEAVLAGTAAAESHRKELASGGPSTPDTATPPPAHARAVLFSEPDSIDDTPPARPKLRRVGSLRSTPTPKVDIVGANDVVVGGGEQIEAVIGSVKAELAAGRGATRPLSMQPTAALPSYKSLRTEAIQKRVQSLRESAGVIEKRLAENLRLGRNIALLTPFQKTTRDRIEAAVPDLANQIRADRIELAKLHLWITMLLKDQERDEREWARVRHVALQAAAKSLRNGLNVMDRRATLAHPIAIPKLSLPDSDDLVAEPQSPGFLTPSSPGLMSPPSVSRAESSGSDLPTTSRFSGMSGVSSVSAISDEPATESQRNSSGSGNSDYELASEYLSASSVLSLHDELDRHLSSEALAGLAQLATSLGNSGPPSATGTPNGASAVNGAKSNSEPGSRSSLSLSGAGLSPNPGSTSALATALASLPNRNSYRHSILSHPGRADAEEHLDDTNDDRNAISMSTGPHRQHQMDRGEQWRPARSATAPANVPPVSLARLPRSPNLSDMQRQQRQQRIGQSWI